MPSAADAELLANAAAGDVAAFGQLIDACAPPLYDFAARLTHNRDEAFEVVRETLIVAGRVIRAGAAPLPFRPWLFGIARANVLAIVDSETRTGNVLAGRGLPDEPLDALAVDRLPGATRAAAAPLAAPTWDALATLDARQLSLLLLNVRTGLNAAETAEAAAIQPANGRLLLDRLKQAAANAVWALILLRDPAQGCADLQTIVAGLPDTAFSPTVRRTITRHGSSCPRCQAARLRSPSSMAILAAFAPLVAPANELATLRAGLLAEFVTPPSQGRRTLRPLAVAASGPKFVRVFAAFLGLAGLAGALGALLLVPASPVALTRDRATEALPPIIQKPPPNIIFVTPTSTATATPSPTAIASATFTPTETLLANTPVPIVVAPIQTPTPGNQVAATLTATPTPSPPPASSPTPFEGTAQVSASPSPTASDDCSPSLSTNVRQVNITGGSSSFTVFNSFCRAVQFSISVAPGDDWLHVQQDFATLDTGGFSTIGVTADRTLLPEGITNGALTITWVGGSLVLPIAATVSGSAPIVGPVAATCGPDSDANVFNARVIDDYGVRTVTLTAIRPDGSTAQAAMTLATGDARDGSWSADITEGISSYTVTATDFAGHAASFPGTCQ